MPAAMQSEAAEAIGPRARRRLAGFMRTLRDNGFAVGLAETRDALTVLASPAAARPESLRPALRALLCSTHTDWERFDEIFDAYWRGRGVRRVATAGTPSDSRRSRQGTTDAAAMQATAGRLDNMEQLETTGGDAADRQERRRDAAAAERLAATDLRHVVDATEIARVHALAERLAHRMRARLVRRTQARRRGRRLDLRRTIHRSVSHGGTPIDLAWRQRKIKPLRLVVLLDGSGSMELYTAFFVRFLHGAAAAVASSGSTH